MKLNLGCGHNVVDGWLNVDYALGARMKNVPGASRFFRQSWDNRIFVFDLRKHFPWADASVDAIYCSHFFEHLTKEQGRQFLVECRRVLKLGASARFIVPDLKKVVEEYQRGDLPATEFVDRLGVLYGNTGTNWKDTLAPFVQLPHKCMYDSEAMQKLMQNSGFTASARLGFESKIENIREIEKEESLHDAVIMEGVAI